MAIASTDIEFRLAGGAANTNPNASLGGAISTAGGGLIADAVANNLWDDVTGDESAAGKTEYRGFYVKNAHATLTWKSVLIWISALTSSADTEFDLALAAEATGAAMATIATETAAPTGVTFTRPTSKVGGLSIGNIGPGSSKGVWIRRTINAGAAAANDSGSVRAEGDTDP